MGASSCPTTVRRDSVPAPLPPALRSALPSLAACAPPAPLHSQQQPQPNTVRVAGGASSTAGPLGSPHHQRFNLVLPASFVECNFMINTVLQRGVNVAFRVACSSASASAPATSSGSGSIVARVHGHVQCHVNPLGLTTYRVSGPQPGAVCGCSLLRWAAEDGCLVIELAPKEQQRQQAPAPVAARRLFGDCLPSPATIRKQPTARARAVAEQQYQPSPLKPQPLQQQQALAPPAAGYQLPAPLPFSLAEPLDAPSQTMMPAAAPMPAAAAASTAFVVQQTAAAAILAPQPQPPARPAAEEVPLRSHASDPGPRAASAATRTLRSRTAASTQTQQQQQPAAIVRSKRLADKAAAAAVASAAEAAPQAGAPKRHRRTASADTGAIVTSAEAAGPECTDAELLALSLDEQHVDGLSGIELLLAAHAMISRREQQQQQEPVGGAEAGRPKRMRLQKTLSL
ncbi:hypothetical protein HXX76_000376 [Chlamydomonas incerta]|uniref:Uncharacterized protein n=1 Tax=Chlamydomonas incerta TaxID=51695 RepID=A0A835WE67_CHLIN|nr:hypothetical protein HXX76_000376 [Chlamydomonas incerta]|eukprot:KAG2445772.1 hypothetical protein HXX76_000376 [Chlamydomonas incerta]